MADDSHFGIGDHSVERAANRISGLGILSGASNEPTPPPTDAPSDPTPETGVSDAGNDAPEQDAAPEDNAAPDEAEAPAEPEPAEGDGTEDEPESGSDTEALADSIDGLAEQLGVPADELAQHLKVRIKEGDAEREVPLAELRRSYLRESDYHTKTRELAEQRREDDAKRQELAEREQHFVREVAPLLESWQQELQQAETWVESLVDPNSPNYNPEAYKGQRDALNARRERVTKATQEAQAAYQRHQKEAQEARQKAIAENEEKLFERFPEFRKSPEKGRAWVKKVRDYIASQGVPKEVAEGVYSWEQLRMANGDRLFRKMTSQAAKAKTEKKLRDAPKFSRPGSKKTEENPKARELRVSKQRLRRTGDLRDAAKVLKDMGVG